MVVAAGENARAMLRNHEYASEEERQALLKTVRNTKPLEARLEKAKERYRL